MAHVPAIVSASFFRRVIVALIYGYVSSRCEGDFTFIVHRLAINDRQDNG
jgi:hypothetical protein